LTCPNCAAEVSGESRFCSRCGTGLPAARAPEQDLAGKSAYGGFWRRVAAALLDGIVVQLISAIFGFVVGILIFVFSPAPFEQTSAVLPTSIALPAGIAIAWLYFALMESSRRQATLGKRTMGVAVTDLDGERFSFWRASARHFAKFISIATLFIGFVLAAFTARKQALHDLLARSLVVRGRR